MFPLETLQLAATKTFSLRLMTTEPLTYISLIY